jgi:tight adherence protein B
VRVPARVVEPLATSQGADRRWKFTLDSSLRSRAEDLGINVVWPPSLLLGVVAVAMFFAGARIGGLIGALVACGVFIAMLTATGPYVRRRVERCTEAALPEVALRVSRSLQTGDSLEQALRALSSNTVPLTRGLNGLIRQIRMGRPVEPALDVWLARATTSAERLLAAALTLGVSHGGPLATALDGVGEGLRDELQHSARRRLLLVQATMSTGVLVSLPVVFAIVASVVRGASIFDGAVGMFLVVGGLLLDALGLWWMSVLMRRLR